MRSRRVLGAAAVVAGELAWIVACGGTPPEEQVLRKFFQASRARDTTVVGSVAAVVFEPRTDGSVQRFEVTDFGREQRQRDGATAAKDVRLRALVRMPDGQLVDKTLVVTMTRPVEDDRRWFITAVRQLPASQTSPAGSSGQRN